MVKNVVKILNCDNKILGTGLLLNHCVVTVDHILGRETKCLIKFDNNTYIAQVLYRGTDLFIDVAILSVEIQESYMPNTSKANLNDNVETKGFPQEDMYRIYTEGRNVSGKVISFNYIDISEQYNYRGSYMTISSHEKITVGFSGAPVFVEETLVGFVARIHIDETPNIINAIPISYFLEINNGYFRNLFGKSVNCDIQNIIDRPKKSLMNPFHFQSNTIDFFGRSEQIDQIFQFCSSTSNVQWWAITGVGGIGKSRLAYEFAKSLNRNIWDVKMLTDACDYKSLKVRTTNIKKNTFIVLDYVQENIQNIGQWLYELSKNDFPYKVRILLLERHGKSYKTSKWIEKINEKNCKYDVLMNMCYNPMMQLDPPFLELSSLSKDDLVSIAQSYYFFKKNDFIDDSIIQCIIEQLSVLDPEFNRPLYLIFLVDAWIDSGDLSKWNKTFILESVLDRELHRINLIIKNIIDDDLLIKAYRNVLGYSTILDGLRYPDEFRVICSEELNIFNSSMEHHRKDIIEIFQQMGFLVMDREGKLFFEGLKPDLLGEYYILNNYSIEKTIKCFFVSPQKFFSFYNRLIDDYQIEVDSDYRTILINMDSSDMSSEQIFYFAEFLCERIIRDNRKYLKLSFDRLKSLYIQNKNEEIARLYAFSLSNMIVEFNLKKTKRFLLELKNLHLQYSDSLDIAIEYANSLVQIIERKSIHASRKEFNILKQLYKKDCFFYNLGMNLCYAKALKILCIKSISNYNSWKICKELKVVFQKFNENNELIFWYAQCLCNIDVELINTNIIVSELVEVCSCALMHSCHISWKLYKLIKSVFEKFRGNNDYILTYAKCLCGLPVNMNNVEEILLELLSLCNYTFIRPIYGRYIVEMYKTCILTKNEAIQWLKSKYDFRLYRKEIEEHFIVISSSEKACKKENKYDNKSKINDDINKAKKLAWLSNGLNYDQCKKVVEEIKILYEQYKDIFEISEYYLTGLIMLSNYNDKNIFDLQKLIKNILELSNEFFEKISENFRMSIYTAISILIQNDLFTEEMLVYFNAFINKVVKDIRSEEETFKIMEMLLNTSKLGRGIVAGDYFENIIINYYHSDIIQRQYVKYLKNKKSYDLEYILEKLFLFYNLNCSIVCDFLANKIIQYTQKKVDKKIIESISNFLSKNRMTVLANVYSKLILKIFLENPKTTYCNILHDLEFEYRPNKNIAQNYAQILFISYKKNIFNFNYIYDQLKKLVNIYTDINIILLFQKILSRMIESSISNNNFTDYIEEQKSIYENYGTLELAIEYCESLVKVCSFISKNDNKRNLKKIKEIRGRFKKKDFVTYEKIIVSQIGESKRNFETEELRDLKNEIQYLCFRADQLDTSEVCIIVDKARKMYRKFGNVDFAIQLCKVLYLLAQTSSKDFINDIFVEIDKIYNRYIYNYEIFKCYVKFFKYAMLIDCNFVVEKMENFEKVLVQKIQKDAPYDEIYDTLLFILNNESIVNEEKKLIDLNIDDIKIPTVYACTKPSKKKMKAILDYFHIRGTLDKPIEIIVIDNQYILLGGYATWFVAKSENIKVIVCKILKIY